ncbi:MAG: hypothetical protein Q8N52_08140, partial [Acidobacteriota bacterium]|nr:hypothetical protein [Acidobacteriota bacterium]
TLIRNVKGLLAAAVCGVSLTACADLASTGSGPAFLIMERVTATAGNGGSAGTTSLLSDVQALVDVTVGGVTVRQPTVFNDLGQATIRVEMKNALSTTAPTAVNSVTINRYRVRYRRTDGRNAEGVDVPYSFDGATTATIAPGSTATVGFDLVRHQAKLERPLVTLIGGRGLIFLTTIAEVTFYGQDQAGNAVSVSGTIDVQFADFGDS